MEAIKNNQKNIIIGLLVAVVLYVVYGWMQGGSGEAGVTGGPEIVLYYAPWCGHSKTFLPIWDQFAQNSPIKATKLDCAGADKARCDANNIPGYPTVKLHINGKTITFEGERSINGLKQFIQNNVK